MTTKPLRLRLVKRDYLKNSMYFTTFFIKSTLKHGYREFKSILVWTSLATATIIFTTCTSLGGTRKNKAWLIRAQ